MFVKTDLRFFSTSKLTNQHCEDHNHATVLLEESRGILANSLRASNGGDDLAVSGDVVEHERSAASHNNLIKTSALA